MWAYIGGIARENGMVALKVGGIEDHLRAIVRLPPTMAVSRALQLLKGGSSKWIHETFPALADFEWQDGYGAFTISKSRLPEVIQYVENQREHHRTMTFQEEYITFLKKHGIEHDGRYVWS